MKPPGLHRPHVELHKSQASQPEGNRRVLVQSDKCGAKASAPTNRGRLVWTELAHYWLPGAGMHHDKCGGRIVGFDLEVSE